MAIDFFKNKNKKQLKNWEIYILSDKESTNKGVTGAWRTLHKQQRHESCTVITWYVSIMQLKRYINSTRGSLHKNCMHFSALIPNIHTGIAWNPAAVPEIGLPCTCSSLSSNWEKRVWVFYKGQWSSEIIRITGQHYGGGGGGGGHVCCKLAVIMLWRDHVFF